MIYKEFKKVVLEMKRDNIKCDVISDVVEYIKGLTNV